MRVPFPDARGRASLRDLDKRALFGNGPQPTDVAQGEAATCSLLAALDALTRGSDQFPLWLFARDARGELRRDPQGQPLLRVYERDRDSTELTPRLIPVPTAVPANQKGEPALAKWVDGKKWVSAVEAAGLQQAFRSGDSDWLNHFRRLIGGAPNQQLEWLTGQVALPVLSMPTHNSASATFDNVSAFARAGKVMTAGTVDADIKDRLQQAKDYQLFAGLPAGKFDWALRTPVARPFHAHAIVAAEEKDGERLITLRDPYGKATFNNTGIITLDYRLFAFFFNLISVVDLPPELRSPRNR